MLDGRNGQFHGELISILPDTSHLQPLIENITAAFQEIIKFSPVYFQKGVRNDGLHKCAAFHLVLRISEYFLAALFQRIIVPSWFVITIASRAEEITLLSMISFFCSSFCVSSFSLI